jgi:rSAM/selenodomain-associated transferase 1
LIFLKAPQPGTVKTRSTTTIGAERACAVYRQMAEMQVTEAKRFTDSVEIHFAPRSAEVDMRNWLGATLEYFAQSEGDLGARMAQAVADAFRLGAQRVALIGGDCPALEADRLAMAFARLRPDAGREPEDAVFGPTSDGRNDLLALSRPEPVPFCSIPWSRPNTLSASKRAALKAGLKTSDLPCEDDVGV